MFHISSQNCWQKYDKATQACCAAYLTCHHLYFLYVPALLLNKFTCFSKTKPYLSLSLSQKNILCKKNIYCAKKTYLFQKNISCAKKTYLFQKNISCAKKHILCKKTYLVQTTCLVHIKHVTTFASSTFPHYCFISSLVSAKLSHILCKKNLCKKKILLKKNISCARQTYLV